MARVSALGKGRRRTSQVPALQYSDGSSSSSEPPSEDEEYVERPALKHAVKTRRRGSQSSQATPFFETPQVSCGDIRTEEDMKAVAKGGVTVPFPWKLHDMLDEMAKEGNEQIVCWQPHGRAFMVHKPKEFVDKIMHHFFNQTKYASFQRQLNLYGFSRLSHGRDKGAYYHMCFVRGQRNLCRGMIRQKIKGTKVRKSLAPEDEPNFYLPQWDKQVEEAQPNGEDPETCHSGQSGMLPVAAPVSPNVGSLPAPQSTPMMRFSFPPLPTVISSRSPSPPTSASGLPFNSPIQIKPASDVLQGSPMDPPMIFSAPWPDTSVRPPMTQSFSNFAKGGDLLFFEGQPFRYLEHIDVVSPESLAAPLMSISGNNLSGMTSSATPGQRDDMMHINYART